MQHGVFPPESKNVVAAGEKIVNVDITKKITEVRTKVGKGEISFTGSREVGNVEREFDEILGSHKSVTKKMMDPGNILVVLKTTKPFRN